MTLPQLPKSPSTGVLQNVSPLLGSCSWIKPACALDWGGKCATSGSPGILPFSPFLKHSGLPHVRFHDLRHGHATLLLLARVHPKVVSERLGHASVGITLDTYSHVLPSMQSEAARAIDELFAPGG